MFQKATFIPTFFYLNIVSISAISGFKPPPGNEVGLCAYSEESLCDLDVWQNPSPRSAGGSCTFQIFTSDPLQKQPEPLQMSKERQLKTTARSWRALMPVAATHSARGDRESHQAFLQSFHDCSMSQSVYLQVVGIIWLDKTITTARNLWTLASGFYFPFWREHIIFHCLFYFFLPYYSCAQYATCSVLIDFPGGTNKQIESRGCLNRGNHFKWSLN